MEVKLGQSQALTNMNSQNIELQKINHTQQNEIKKIEEEIKNKLQGKEEIDPKKLNEAVNDLNKKLDMLNSQLRIEIDEDTGIQVVKIVDKDTKEVIRQIPPEAVLKVAKYLNEVTGLLFDKKA